ncbi:isochorismatase family cysteine hydrolase [Oscillospiraceae bacterium PP1C4]
MKKLLVVVDYQNDFVSGSLGFPKAAELEEVICRKIEQYKTRGDTVAFTFDTHDADYLQTQEGRNLPVEHCVKGTQGWQLYGKVAACCDETTPCFYKLAFGSMELARYVQAEHYDEIELCGLVSNICVISNAVLLKAALPEAVVCVDANCTASFDCVMNEKTLDVMEGLQIKVSNR